MVGRMTRAWRWTRDWVWPALDPLPPGYEERVRARIDDVPSFLTAGMDDIRAWEAGIVDETTHEQERRARADEKLTNALAVVVAAAIAIVAGLAVFLTQGAVEKFGGASVIAAVGPAVYVGAQMTNVFLSATEGLRARAYLAGQAQVPMPAEDARLRLLRECRDRHRANVENTELTNQKVSQWKLCVVAFRNAGVGILVELAVVAFILIYRAIWH